MLKKHLAGYEPPNENNSFGDWTPTICGLELEDRFLTENEKEVTCKNCIRVMDKNTIRSVINSITRYLDKDCTLVQYNGEVVAPKGIEQPSDHYLFKTEWVDQRCGCCEDDYYGHMYFQYKGKYLKFYYTC